MGGVHDRRIFSKGASKGNFSRMSNFENFEKFPLENPLDKSEDHLPTPMTFLARLAFQWPGRFVHLKSRRPPELGHLGHS